MNLLDKKKDKIFFTLIIVIPLIIYLFTHFYLIPNLFSFDDNFFNEEKGFFEGDGISVTDFDYIFLKKESSVITIKNTFSVKTIQGKEIISINKNYLIDSKTGSHIGDKDGYLFAPRGLKKNQTFKYWHVNYDKELELVYESEEIIKGVKVYKFGADFSVDQTENLSHLSKVPEERGVNVDVSLSLWIEPVSGWLIKYEDSAIAYYYDQKTKERIVPWNKFSNSYKQKSIENQVEIAKKQKNLINILEIIIPFVLLFILLSIFFINKNKKTFLFILLSSSVLLIFIIFNFFINSEKSDPMKIGIARWASEDKEGNDIFTQNIKGFKDALNEAGYKEGVDVIYEIKYGDFDHDKQTEIAKTFIKEDFDLIFSQTTPGTLILKDIIVNRPIVFSVVTFPVEAGLINSLSNSKNNLVGTRNWVHSRIQLKNFLSIVPNISSIGFVHRKNEPNSTIQLQEMRDVVRDMNKDIEIVEIAGEDFEELSKNFYDKTKNIDSIFSACSTIVVGKVEKLITSFAKENKIPSFSCSQSGVENGNLISTFTDFYEIGKLSGEKAALILSGASPESLQTNTVPRPKVYLNEKTANILDIHLSQKIKVNSEKVIK